MNNEREEIKEKNNFLVPIFIIIILGLAAYIAYDHFILDKNQEVKTEEKNTEDKKEEKEEEKTSESSEKSTLFDKEVLIAEECSNGKCEKDFGTFVLGNKNHTASIYISDKDVTDSYKAEITLDNKTISIKDIYSEKFHKIVKIGTDYLAIGITSGPGVGYRIEIYDKNLNLIKGYNSLYVSREIARDEKMYNNYIDYFTVKDNTFTHYSCDVNYNTGEQSLVKHLVTINNETFEEKEISRVKEYCSSN